MKKSDLIAAAAKKAQLRPAGAGAALLSAIAEQLAAGQEVALPDFGTFAEKSREARTRRNPRTGESTSVAASKTAAFRPGKGPKGVLS